MVAVAVTVSRVISSCLFVSCALREVTGGCEEFAKRRDPNNLGNEVKKRGDLDGGVICRLRDRFSLSKQVSRTLRMLLRCWRLFPGALTSLRQSGDRSGV